MKPHLFLLPFIFFAQTSFAQSFLLRGTVYSLEDSVTIPATVYNETGGDGVIANEHGEFSLRASAGDIIRVSAIGLESYLFTASTGETYRHIYLTPTVHPIDTIFIRPFLPKQLFPSAFKSLNLPDENNINLNIPDDVALYFPVAPNEERVPAPNELPFVATMTIPRGPTKLQKEEARLNGQKKVMDEIDRKYGNAFISRLTGLQEDEKILALKKFCNFSKEFILHNTEYDIAVAIVDCFKEFEKKQN